MEYKELFEELFTQAKAMGACDKLSGGENLSELCALFRSVDGVEFCMQNRFPSMATLREFKRLGVQQYGIYIDAGDVEIDNPESVILVGRTNATINVNTHGKHRVCAMRGANATINASEWAVCVTKADASCHFLKLATDHAIVL